MMKIKISLATLVIIMLIASVVNVTGINIGPKKIIKKLNNQDFTHVVFCEQGSATWCPYCPMTSDALYKIYSSSEYPFYYVSLVYDKNEKAKYRLLNDYNLKGFPTCFFDGGYEVIYGGYPTEDPYKNKILLSGEREVANVDISLDANWVSGCCNKIVSCEVTIFNNEEQPYSGFLKIYLTEINSRWYDYNGNPYHFGFLDFIADTGVNVSPKEKLNLVYEWNPSESEYSDVDPSNLMVIGVLFNSEEHQGYSDPPDNTKQFTAYYVDDADVDVVLEGNLPPEVGIVTPKEGYLYLFNKPRTRMPFGNTVIIGETDVEVYANDDTSVERVEFYIDNNLKKEIYEEPYVWILDSLLFGKHLLKVIAYDDQGKSSSVEMEITAFII